MLRPVLLIALVCLLPYTQLQAQTRHKGKKHTGHKAKKEAAPLVTYRDRIYFPDYYTFYDPQRKGYVYWSDNRWNVTPDAPPFMKDVQTSKWRIQVLKDETLQLPEDRYEQYLKLYPPQQTSPSVPVPIITVSPVR